MNSFLTLKNLTVSIIYLFIYLFIYLTYWFFPLVIMPYFTSSRHTKVTFKYRHINANHFTSLSLALYEHIRTYWLDWWREHQCSQQTDSLVWQMTIVNAWWLCMSIHVQLLDNTVHTFRSGLATHVITNGLTNCVTAHLSNNPEYFSQRETTVFLVL